MWTDRIWPSYVFGLVTPQDGLVTPPLCGLCADLLKNVPNLSENQDFQDFSIRAFKLAANQEKQVVTFFAFLPLYIGVSGSLMPCKR